MNALWRLTALPREEFDATYGATLVRFWRYVAAPEGAAWVKLKEQALTGAVAALRVRQARVLPRFGAVEDSARLAEVMSLALTVAVVAERFGLVVGRAISPGWCPLLSDVPVSVELSGDVPPRSYGALLIPGLVGEPSLSWLAQEPLAMRELAAYFGDAPSELRAIAEEAERRIGLPIVGPGRLAGNQMTEFTRTASAEAKAAPRNSRLPVSREEPRDDDGQPEVRDGKQHTGAIGGDGAGWRWVNWVRTGFRDGTIPVNASGGWLHNLAGEAYVVEPDCFEAFALQENVGTKTLKNRVARLRRHRKRPSAAGAASTFHARLADGRQVKGMVFPGSLIWDDAPPPQANGAMATRGGAR